MKKTTKIVFLTILTLLVLSLGVNAQIATGDCANGTNWVISSDGTLTINGSGSMDDYTSANPAPWTSYISNIKKIVISSNVTDIGNRAFINCTGITSVTIPDSITEIGSYAFMGCTGLTEVTFGNGLTSIGSSAFGNCSNIAKVNIPDFDTWCKISFANSTSNPASFPKVFCVDGVETTVAVISSGVTSIGAYAFRATNMEKIYVPDSVTSIGTNAFAYCSNLTLCIGKGSYAETYATENKIKYSYAGYATTDIIWEYDSSTQTLTIKGKGAIPNFSASSPAPWATLSADVKSIVVGEGITAVGNRAFTSFTAATSAVIPNSVASIGDYVFTGCTALTDITIGTGLVSVGTGAFSNCNALKAVHIFDFDSWCKIKFANVMANPAYLAKSFYINGEHITEVTLSDNVTSIGDYAFRATDITKIVVPSSVTSIGTGAFAYATSLLVYVEEGSYAQTYAKDNSVNCVVHGTCGDTATWQYTSKTGELIIGGTGAMKDYSTSAPAPWSIYATGIKKVIIEDGITAIGVRAFISCTALTTAVLPDSVETIGTYAFTGCSALKEVTIGTGVKTISSNAFSNCSALAKVHIKDFDAWCSINFESVYSNPASTAKNFYVNGELVTEITISDTVTSIGAYAFRATDITKITIPNSVTSIGTNAFAYCSKLTLHAAADSYAATYAYSNSVNCSITGSCGADATWQFISKTGELIISGTGAMTDYSTATPAPWKPYIDSIKSVTVEEGITTIGVRAFISCTALTTAVLPDSVINIGTYAFTGCSALTDITIGNGVKEIASNAFSNCSALAKVHIKDFDAWCNITFASPYSNPASTAKNFYINGKLVTEVVLSHKITALGAYTFRATNITKIIILDTVATIDSTALAYCSALTIHGFEGTAAETYATANNLPFVALGDGIASGTCGENLTWKIKKNGALVISGVGAMEGYSESNPAWYDYRNLIKTVVIEEGTTSISSGAFCDLVNVISITIAESVTSIGTAPFTGCASFTIYGYEGSKAESFANSNGYSFVSLTCVAHSWSEWVTDKAPTCTASGEKHRVCSACGGVEYESIDALGHTYKTTVTAPGCSTTGYTTYTCTVCGYSYTGDTTSALGHTYKDTVVAPTCTTGGYTEHLCTVCGYSYVGSKVSALGHDYKSTVTPVTCTTDGYTTHVCSNCNDTYVDNKISATGHKYKVTVIAPTCEEDGYTTHSCTVCGDSYIDAETEATGHTWGVWITDLEPTYTEEGTRHRKCSSCGKAENETIPAIGGEGATEAVFTLTNAKGRPGETVKIEVWLKSVALINSIAFSSISYDEDVLEFVGFTDYDEIEKISVLPPAFDVEKMTFVIALEEDVAFDGYLCSLEFRIKDDATDCITTITGDPLVKYDWETATSTVEDGEVSVYTYLIGDIDMDKDVDVDDAVLLFQYSMIPQVYPIIYPGDTDFTKDGELNLQDALALFRYSMLPDVYPLN